MAKTSFDTELFSVFEEGQSSVILGNYKLEFYMKSKDKLNPTFTSYYGYGQRENPTFIIYKFRPDAVEDEDGKWEMIGEIGSYYLYNGAHEHPPEEWKTKKFILKEVEEEMQSCIEKQRKARNKELAKERDQRNAAEAAAKGMTVEDYMFSKKVVRTEKRQGKNVEALKEQIAASFAYGKSLDKLEKAERGEIQLKNYVDDGNDS
jgi:hypothetical protein